MSESTSPYDASDRIPKDVLHDLCSRFLINIPSSEKCDMVRICFQVELAHWYYIDFCRQDNPDLPACSIKGFMARIFNEFEFLNSSGESVEQIFDNWKQYKFRVPVYGAIILDESLENVLLVQGFHNRISWGFPKGKVNKDETGIECAIREVMEEVSFDISPFVNADRFLENTILDHQIRLYIAPGVPSNFKFKPSTRGEIKEIRWFRIADLPSHKKDTTPKERLGLQANNFFLISPFLRPLKKWLAENPGASSYRSPARDGRSVSIPSEDVSDVDTGQKAAFVNKQLLLKEQENFRQMHLLMHPLAVNKDNEEQLKKLLGVKQAAHSARKQPEAIRKLLTGTVDVSAGPSPEMQQTGIRDVKASSTIDGTVYAGLPRNKSFPVDMTRAGREAASAFIVVPPSTSRVAGVEETVQRVADQSSGTRALRPESGYRDDDLSFKPMKAETKPAQADRTSHKATVSSSHDRRKSGASFSKQAKPTKQVAVAESMKQMEQVRGEASADPAGAGREKLRDALSDFSFDAPAFVNFTFDRAAIMATIY